MKTHEMRKSAGTKGQTNSQEKTRMTLVTLGGQIVLGAEIVVEFPADAAHEEEYEALKSLAETIGERPDLMDKMSEVHTCAWLHEFRRTISDRSKVVFRFVRNKADELELESDD